MDVVRITPLQRHTKSIFPVLFNSNHILTGITTKPCNLSHLYLPFSYSNPNSGPFHKKIARIMLMRYRFIFFQFPSLHLSAPIYFLNSPNLSRFMFDIYTATEHKHADMYGNNDESSPDGDDKHRLFFTDEYLRNTIR